MLRFTLPFIYKDKFLLILGAFCHSFEKNLHYDQLVAAGFVKSNVRTLQITLPLIYKDTFQLILGAIFEVSNQNLRIAQEKAAGFVQNRNEISSIQVEISCFSNPVNFWRKIIFIYICLQKQTSKH